MPIQRLSFEFIDYCYLLLPFGESLPQKTNGGNSHAQFILCIFALSMLYLVRTTTYLFLIIGFAIWVKF